MLYELNLMVYELNLMVYGLNLMMYALKYNAARIEKGMKKGKNQYLHNQEIENFIAAKDARNESYSQADIAYINEYEGAGGLASKGATGEGLLYEFYTPAFIVELMWDLARFHGFKENYHDGYVLEPAAGTGRMLKHVKDYRKCVAFETNPVSARICELTYPGVEVHKGHFETGFLAPNRFTRRITKGGIPPYIYPGSQTRVTEVKDGLTWLTRYPFDLAITNPPYGIYQNKYSSFFPEGRKVKQTEIFFMLMSLKLLKPGGLMVFITSSNFMRNGDSYNTGKAELAKICNIVDAYRLPAVFHNTEVPTDILVFRRK